MQPPMHNFCHLDSDPRNSTHHAAPASGFQSGLSPVFFENILSRICRTYTFGAKRFISG